LQFDRIDYKSFLHLKMEGGKKRKIFCRILSDRAIKWRKKNRDLILSHDEKSMIYKPTNKTSPPPPKLTNDALRCIFSFLSPWELLNLRFVCKQWNCVIVNTSMFWNLKHVETRNTFREYVYHMFLNVRDEEKLIDHFFAYPDIFHCICRIVLGQERYKGKSTKYKLVFGNYMLSRRSRELYTGSIKIKIQNFLEVYRQKICMHLPKSFQIRN
jgi:F-box domain